MTIQHQFDHANPYWELGRPHRRTIAHWALYEPVYDRFLFTSDVQDLVILQEIRMLCSSRYNLILCDLSTAENFHWELVDNLCCENWTLDHSTKLDLSHVLSAPCDATILTPSSELDETQMLCVQQEKNWIQFVNHWIRWIRRDHKDAWEQINEFIEEIFDMQANDQRLRTIELHRLIRRELYLGRDIESTQNTISKYIENF